MSDAATDPATNGNGSKFHAAVQSAVTSLIFRAVMTVVLGLVGYMVADVHGDLKKASASIGDLRTEISGSQAVLKTKVEDHERRLGKLEDWRTQPSNRGNP